MLRAFSALNFQQGRYPLDGKLKLTELCSSMKRIDLQHLMTQKYLNFPLPRLQIRRRYLLDVVLPENIAHHQSRQRRYCTYFLPPTAYTQGKFYKFYDF